MASCLQRLLRPFSLLLGLLFVAGSAQADMDDPGWRDFLARFVVDGRVIDTANRSISHTEGQGWSMLLAVHHGDRQTFDQLWRWTEDHLARRDVALYSWRFDPTTTPSVSDPNNASDGDLMIAWALDRAAQRWGGKAYAVRSAEVRTAIGTNLVRDFAGSKVLLPAMDGFEHPDGLVINLSYWVIPAFKRFAELEPQGPWLALVESGGKLLARAQFGAQKLPADWLRLDPRGGLSPAEGWPPRFGFENIRVPLYFSWGNQRGIGTLENIAVFWSRQALPPAWVDVTSGERAPYPLSEGGRAIKALLIGDPDGVPQVAGQDENYYSAILLQLVRVALHDLGVS
ncbi:glycosyl hydrolase family 8 [Halotalea alkalilenta]|uniref:glycosyl hydrolase family 8 n=1 Tax=Halotalea alkalilenta TaxID=376489 RepID=UPI0007D08E5D|nr:glycosyl hydrolase family 8 [Halotalea alkalilenta]